jgi:hypothetical protein
MANAQTTVELITGGARVSGTNPVPTAEQGCTYRGEETLTPNGASVAATIPASANMAQITAEGGAVYYTINGAAASANSGGYIPDGQSRVTFPLAAFTSLHVYSAAGATKAHIMYFTA